MCLKLVCILISPPFFYLSRLHNLHPWYWTSSLYSLTSSREKSAFAHFAAAITNHCNSAFSFYQIPITAGWTETAWYERLAQHLYAGLTVWLEQWSPIQVLTGMLSRHLYDGNWLPLAHVLYVVNSKCKHTMRATVVQFSTNVTGGYICSHMASNLFWRITMCNTFLLVH